MVPLVEVLAAVPELGAAEDVPAAALVAEDVLAAALAAEPAAEPLDAAVAPEAPGCAVTACVSACRRLEKRFTPCEDGAELELLPPAELTDVPGVRCGGAYRPIL